MSSSLVVDIAPVLPSAGTGMEIPIITPIRNRASTFPGWPDQDLWQTLRMTRDGPRSNDRGVERGVGLGRLRVCYDLERGEVPRQWCAVVFRDPAGRVRRANLVVTNTRLVFSCRHPHALDLVAIARIDHHARFGREWFTIDTYDEMPTRFSGRGRRMRRLCAALPAAAGSAGERRRSPRPERPRRPEPDGGQPSGATTAGTNAPATPRSSRPRS
jgi:hypothetical protein